MDLRLVDDEAQEVVREEGQGQAEGDEDEHQPDDRLDEDVTDVERVHELVLGQDSPPSRLAIGRRSGR